MRLELSRLAQQHGYEPTPITLPLSPPTDGPQILEGRLVTTNTDLSRIRLRGWAFPFPSADRLPPLYYRHDPREVAGVVEALEYNAKGELQVRACVEHERAKRCGAWSAGFTVLRYELRALDTPNWHALVTEARLDEVSLVESPRDPTALVTLRYPPAPEAEFYDLMIARVALLQKALMEMRVR